MLQFLRRLMCVWLLPIVVGSLWVSASFDTAQPSIPALENDPTGSRESPSVRLYLDRLKKAQRAVAVIAPDARTTSL